MPLIFNKRQRSGGTLFCVWKISESEEALLSLLSPCLQTYYMPQLKAMHSEKRRLEWLAVRVVAHKVANIDGHIIYDSQGIPAVDSRSRHISISHSGDTVFVAFSARRIGVDVQYYSDKLLKVAAHFINDEELNNINSGLLIDKSQGDGIYYKNNGTTQITSKIKRAHLLIWGAKESIYKLCGIKDLDLKNSVTVDVRDVYRYGCIAATVNPDYVKNNPVKSRKITIKYMFSGDCVYVVAEDD